MSVTATQKITKIQIGDTAYEIDFTTHSHPVTDENDNQTVAVGTATETTATFGKNATVKFIAGNNVTLTGNPSQNTITIAASDSKVTSTTNHYEPVTATLSALTASVTSTTAASWGSTKLLTGVTLQRDERGHVTGLSVDSVTMPSNPDTNLVTSVNGQTGSVTISVPAAAKDAKITIAASSSSATSTTFGDFTTNQATNETIYIPVASTTSAGLLSAQDKLKIDSFDTFPIDKVMLDGPLRLTQTFGKYTKPANKYWYEVGNANMSLKDLLLDAFSSSDADVEDNEVEDKTVFATLPTAIPSVSLSASSVSGEVGSDVSVNLSPSFGATTAGAFKYGSIVNGVVDKGSTGKQTGVTFGRSATVSSTISGLTTATSSVTAPEGSVTITVTATHTRSAITKHPISSKGNDIYSEMSSTYKQQGASSTTASVTVTGYRCIFSGATTDSNFLNNLNSSENSATTNRQKLLGSKTQAGKKDIIVSVSSTSKAIYCAIPDTLSYSNVVVKIYNDMFPDSPWFDTTETLETKTNIPVSGAGSASSKNYKVYVYKPTSGKFIDGTQYKFVIS